MSKNRNRRPIVASNAGNASANGATPAGTAPPLVARDVTDDVDVASKFMRENPKGSIPADTSGDDVGSLATAVDATAPNPADGAIVENHDGSATAPGTAVPEAITTQPNAATPEGSAVDATGVPVPTGGEVPPATLAETPAAEVLAAATPSAPAAVVEPAKPTYAPDEKFDLMPGVEPWTREQTVTALQERAQLIPQAEEATQFRQFFGGDFKSAAERWTPVLRTLASDPTKAQLAQSVLDADPATLDYLAQSLQYFNSPEARELRGVQPGTPTAQTAPAAQPSQEMARYERTIQHLQKQAMASRATSEWAQAEAKYPFLRTDAKARQALVTVASEMFSADERSGKDPLECRGLLDAMNTQGPFLESMAIAASKLGVSAPVRETPSAAAAALQPPAPAAPVGAPPQPGLLGSSGPAPTIGRSANAPQVFRGNSDDAVKAFVTDYPR